jgi:hypothetical protein
LSTRWRGASSLIADHLYVVRDHCNVWISRRLQHVLVSLYLSLWLFLWILFLVVVECAETSASPCSFPSEVAYDRMLVFLVCWFVVCGRVRKLSFLRDLSSAL